MHRDRGTVALFGPIHLRHMESVLHHALYTLPARTDHVLSAGCLP